MDGVASYVARADAIDVVRKMYKLRDSRYADVTVWCQSNKFLAHKAVLAAGSPQFSAMFEELPGQLVQNPIIVMNEPDPDTVEAMLNIMYGERAEVPRELMPDFVKLCDYFGVDHRVASVRRIPRDDEESHYGTSADASPLPYSEEDLTKMEPPRKLDPSVIPDIISRRHPILPMGQIFWRAQLEGSHKPVMFCEACQFVTKSETTVRDHLISVHPSLVDEVETSRAKPPAEYLATLERTNPVPETGVPVLPERTHPLVQHGVKIRDVDDLRKVSANLLARANALLKPKRNSMVRTPAKIPRPEERPSSSHLLSDSSFPSSVEAQDYSLKEPECEKCGREFDSETSLAIHRSRWCLPLEKRAALCARMMEFPVQLNRLKTVEERGEKAAAQRVEEQLRAKGFFDEDVFPSKDGKLKITVKREPVDSRHYLDQVIFEADCVTAPCEEILAGALEPLRQGPGGDCPGCAVLHARAELFSEPSAFVGTLKPMQKTCVTPESPSRREACVKKHLRIEQSLGPNSVESSMDAVMSSADYPPMRGSSLSPGSSLSSRMLLNPDTETSVTTHDEKRKQVIKEIQRRLLEHDADYLADRRMRRYHDEFRFDAHLPNEIAQNRDAPGTGDDEDSVPIIVHYQKPKNVPFKFTESAETMRGLY